MNNLHFLHPEWFWLLLVIPILWGIRLVYRQSLGNWEPIVDKHLMPFVLSGQQGQRGLWSSVWLSLALLLAVVAMAGPAWEKREVPVFQNQQALVVAMDFSTSMRAEDEKPDRMTVARFKLLDLLKNRTDGQTALIVFAGDAFVVSPLTDDRATIEEQVKYLTPDIMPAQGSLLTPAIQRADDLLKQAGMSKGNILLLTDGSADVEQAQQAAATSARQGYPVSILAIGSDQGAPIPQPRGGFVSDSTGKTVMAKVNSDDLKAIARAGGGLYVHAALGDADLNQLSGQWQLQVNDSLVTSQGRQIDTWVNEGYWLILILLPLAALAFRRGWLGAVLVVMFLPQPQPVYAAGWADLWQTPDQQGQVAMQQGQLSQAGQLFENRSWKAAAAYKQGDYANAEQLYNLSDSAVGRYNYGNALAKQGKFEEAIKAYEQALKLEPNLQDAKTNLEMVKKALEQQKKQDQQQNNPQQNNASQAQSGQNNQQQQDQQAQQNQSGQQQQQGSQNNSTNNSSQSQQNPANPAQAQDKNNTGKQDEQAAQQGQPDEKANEGKADAAKQARAQQQNKNAGDEQPLTVEQAMQQREQQQATEQWLRRIPDDPAGLWRRKFQYQYQQHGFQPRGEAW